MNLRFADLNVCRLPGLGSDLNLAELSPQLNVVYGRNGIGKSRTALAMTGLLWPTDAGLSKALRGSRIGAKLTDSNGNVWRFELNEALRLDCRDENSVQKALPSLPPADTASRYRITLNDLLAQGGEDGLIAAIQREAAGGYDVAKAAQTCNFMPSPPRPVGVVSQLTTAEAAHQTVKRKQEEIRRKADGRESLVKEKMDAETAQTDSQAIDKLLKARQSRTALEFARSVVDEFPPALEYLRSEDSGTLENLLQKRQAQVAEIRHLRTLRQEAWISAQRSGLADSAGVPESAWVVLTTQLANITELKRELAEAENDLAASQKEHEAAARALFRISTPAHALVADSLPDLSADDIANIGNFMRRAMDVNARAAEARVHRQWRDNEATNVVESNGQLPHFQNAVNLLEQWLSTAPPAVIIERHIPITPTVAAGLPLSPVGTTFVAITLVLAVIGIVGESFIVAQKVSAVGFLGLLLAVLILAATYLLIAARMRQTAAAAIFAPMANLSTPVPQTPDPRVAIQQNFAVTGAPEPADWEIGSVGRQLRILRDRVVAMQADLIATQRWEDVKPQIIEAERALLSINHERADLAANLQINLQHLEPNGASLLLLCNAVITLRQSEKKLAAAQGLRDHGQALYEAAYAVFGRKIAAFGSAVSKEDFFSAQAAFADLEQRKRQFDEADNILDTVRKDLKTSFANVQQRIRDRRSIWQRLKLGDKPNVEETVQEQRLKLGGKPNVEETVQEWSKLLPDYQVAKERRTAAEVENRLAEKIQVDFFAEHPLLASRVTDWGKKSDIELDASRTVDRDLASKLEGTQRQLTETDLEIKQAREGSDLEAASANCEQCRNVLRDARDKAAASVLGNLLVEKVRKDSEEDELPIVFKRARAIFSNFTGGHWKLLFDRTESGEHQFRAQDTTPGISEFSAVRLLGELSSGTRVQLLLAIRLAFIETQEIGFASPPLMLDETLANSDPERMDAIINATLSLVRDGRQVFYFTARHDEVARWIKAAEVRTEAGDPIDCQDFDLGAALGRESVLPQTELISFLKQDPALLSFVGKDAATIAAEISVPAINRSLPPGNAHLFHLLHHDLASLHSLLKGKITTELQWRQVRDAGGGAFDLATGTKDEIDAYINIADAFWDAYSEGRGKKLTYNDLHVPCKDSTHLQHLWKVAEKVDYDANEFMLRIAQNCPDRPNYMLAKLDKRIQENLTSAGCLVSGNPLTADEIRVRVLARISGSPLSVDKIAARVEYLCRAYGVGGASANPDLPANSALIAGETAETPQSDRTLFRAADAADPSPETRSILKATSKRIGPS